MVREAMRERFLETLKESGGSAGNSRLRSELGWQEDTYWAVHAALVEDGAVVAGRGRGGSVARVNGEKHPPAIQAQPGLGGQARRRASQRACPAQSRQRRQPLRADVQEHRRRAVEGGGLRHRARLHRADLVDAVPEIPGRPGAEPASRRPNCTASATRSSSTPRTAGRPGPRRRSRTARSTTTRR